MSKTALITGAEGFVGGHLAKALLSAGYEVYGTALNERDFNKAVGKEKMVQLDICKPDMTDQLISQLKPDLLFHLAAQSSVALSWSKPELTIDVNIKGIINVLNSVKKFCPSCRVLIIGSSEEYGMIDYSKPVKEDSVLNPQNLYAITKETQERIGKLYSKAYGLNIMMTRSFNHFGSGQGVGFVVADFCNQIAKIEKGIQPPVINVGNLNSKRDFIYIDDVIKAYLLIAEKGKAGEIYNVGSSNPRLVSDILQELLTLSKVKIEVNVDKTKFRPIDVFSIEADISKLKALGYSTNTDFSSALSKTLDYYRSNTII